MLCPYCGGELTLGTAEAHYTSTFYQRFYLSFCDEENSKKGVFSRSIIQSQDAEEVPGGYCPACRKIFAVFDQAF